jgi:WD40 repeat protein
MAPPPSGSSKLDSAHIVLFSPQALNQLLVITSGARLIKFNATNGQLLSEVSNIHRSECSSLAVDKTGRYLLTAGDKVVKMWDYSMALDLNFQVYHFIMVVCTVLSKYAVIFICI